VTNKDGRKNQARFFTNSTLSIARLRFLKVAYKYLNKGLNMKRPELKRPDA